LISSLFIKWIFLLNKMVDNFKNEIDLNVWERWLNKMCVRRKKYQIYFFLFHLISWLMIWLEEEEEEDEEMRDDFKNDDLFTSNIRLTNLKNKWDMRW